MNENQKHGKGLADAMALHWPCRWHALMGRPDLTIWWMMK